MEGSPCCPVRKNACPPASHQCTISPVGYDIGCLLIRRLECPIPDEDVHSPLKLTRERGGLHWRSV